MFPMAESATYDEALESWSWMLVDHTYTVVRNPCLTLIINIE